MTESYLSKKLNFITLTFETFESRWLHSRRQLVVHHFFVHWKDNENDVSLHNS